MSLFKIDKAKMPSYLLLCFQVVAHLSIIPMIIWGTKLDWILSFFVYFLTGCVGMSITYHRLLSHRCWNPPKFFEEIATLITTLGLTGSSIAWVAIHREHHRYSDTAKDPHSPYFQPWWRVQFLSMFHHPNVKLVTDLMRHPFHRLVHKNYFKIQFAWILILLLIHPFFVISVYLFPAAVLWSTGSAVNSMGHLIGYKNFETHDEARNNILLGYVVWGEGWHNNHHRYPKRAYYGGERWYEIDISGLVIKFLVLFSPKKTTSTVEGS